MARVGQPGPGGWAIGRLAERPGPAARSLAYRPGSVPVLGQWKRNELPVFTALPRGAAGGLARRRRETARPARADRGLVRDAAPDAAGRGSWPLWSIRARSGRRSCSCRRAASSAASAHFAEQPGESDATLGREARAVLVDRDGNIWAATNAWGQTSVFRTNQDGSPYEETVLGPRGAVKKFSPDGRLLGAVSLLDTPLDLVAVLADDVPVLLASYRSVSQYHGAQVREGIMLVRTADAARIGEVKAPAGSVCVDAAGRVWTADVAGHVSCCDLRGRRLLDAAASPAAAVPDARLPASSPLPVMLRCGTGGGVWTLHTLGRKLAALDAKGEPQGEPQPIAAAAGAVWRLSLAGARARGDCRAELLAAVRPQPPPRPRCRRL